MKPANIQAGQINKLIFSVIFFHCITRFDNGTIVKTYHHKTKRLPNRKKLDAGSRAEYGFSNYRFSIRRRLQKYSFNKNLTVYFSILIGSKVSSYHGSKKGTNKRNEYQSYKIKSFNLKPKIKT